MIPMTVYLDRNPRKTNNISKKMTIHIKNTQSKFSQSCTKLGMSEKYLYVVGMSLFWYTDGV